MVILKEHQEVLGLMYNDGQDTVLRTRTVFSNDTNVLENRHRKSVRGREVEKRRGRRGWRSFLPTAIQMIISCFCHVKLKRECFLFSSSVPNRTIGRWTRLARVVPYLVPINLIKRHRTCPREEGRERDGAAEYLPHAKPAKTWTS